VDLTGIIESKYTGVPVYKKRYLVVESLNIRKIIFMEDYDE
jgi:hypothetical protein